MKFSLLPFLLCACASTAALEGGDSAAHRRPNILYILADDLGYGEVGCYGQTKIQTPNIDALAASGMRFTQHYSGSPVCAPSRCVLLTGLHTGHSIVRDNWERGGWEKDSPEGQYPLPMGTVTLARELQTAGYKTSVIGKWGLGGPETTGHPNEQGFDHFFGYLCQRWAHNYYPDHLWRNGDRVDLTDNEYFKAHQKIDEPLSSESEYWERYTGGTYAPDAMIAEAEEFIRASADEPFFMLFASPVPHAALQVPPADLDQYPAEWDAEHYLGQRSYLPHPSPRRAYAAMVSRFDRDIGRLLSVLDELNLTNDTIVMFSSDNGPTFNGGTDSEFFDSAAGLNGLKCSVLEGGIRVPFIVRYPDQVESGVISPVVSGFQDVLPTVLELTGVPAVANIDGISLAPTLLGNGPQPLHDALYWEYRGQQAMRAGDWKAVRRKLKAGSDRIELYHLGRDPAESTDVADQHPELVERFSAEMANRRFPSDVYPLAFIDD